MGIKYPYFEMQTWFSSRLDYYLFSNYH